MRHWGLFGMGFGRRGRRSGLLLSVLTGVLVAAAVAGCSWWLLWTLLGVEPETPNRLQLTMIALAVTAGVGGAVALVVAYRRQRDLERGRFADVFGAAAAQLGAADVAVRIAGVYAMAGVADEFSAWGRRQQCVDVLCAYLRLPYAPDAGDNHLVSRTERREEDGAAVERVYHYRQNDRPVRATIARVIADRLRQTAETSWSDCDFDFTGAVFEDADFRFATFGGRDTRFADAVFLGTDTTSFEGARFLGKRITFRGATFRGRAASFQRAVFRPAVVDRSERGGSVTSFVDTTFACPVAFDEAVFAGARTTFERATFTGDRTGFADASFAAALTTFGRAVFDGDRVCFAGAEFTGARIAFTATHFYARGTSFDGCALGERPRWRTGGTTDIDFTDAEYHGAVSFADAVFEARTVLFTGGDFFGEISFRRSGLHAREVRFDRPRAWVGTHFDWDEVPAAKPDNVKPEPWPPTPVERPTKAADQPTQG
ncbi:pentapeptide repeat-containing protein [Nocardia sp. NPDC050406]|uniref:pentapeptide repeat-containing protein n=1 Tax=Nocardia sp. NPDC050406 TaxID=3364318 RepID=UPI0037B1D458